MSASRDNSQKVTFIYSNLYKIYKTGKGHEEVFAAHKKPITDLKDNLNKLTGLHQKLREMIIELEEILKR